MVTIKEEKYPIKDNKFEYMGNHYDCKRAIKKDIKLITQEAEETHKNSFDELYDRSTLRPSFVRLFVDVGAIRHNYIVAIHTWNNAGGSKCSLDVAKQVSDIDSFNYYILEYIGDELENGTYLLKKL